MDEADKAKLRELIKEERDTTATYCRSLQGLGGAASTNATAALQAMTNAQDAVNAALS